MYHPDKAFTIAYDWFVILELLEARTQSHVELKLFLASDHHLTGNVALSIDYFPWKDGPPNEPDHGSIRVLTPHQRINLQKGLHSLLMQEYESELARP